MILESQMTNSIQKYGKQKVYNVYNQNKSLGEQYLYKMCQYVYDEKIPIQDVLLLFEHIKALGLNYGNINTLTYQQLKQKVDGESSQEQSYLKNPIYVSPSKLIEVYYIDSFDFANGLQLKTTWCICHDMQQWNLLNNGSTFYLIRNLNFSKRSKCRYVIARVYNNGNIEYMDMSNNVIISGGGNKPSLETYTNSLEGAIAVLKPRQEKSISTQHHHTITKNNEQCEKTSQNKSTKIITESQIRRIVRESMRKVLNESKEYKLIGTNEEFTFDNGKKGFALLHLSDGYGETFVIEDDHCYVAYNVGVDGVFREATYIYPELFNAMKKYLPYLQR